MNKINLIETVTKGSHIRKTVDPGLIIGDKKNGYIPGDILDANAVIDVLADVWDALESLDKRVTALEPIPVEGDVQVFADPECTRYATGEVNKVYVRVNRPWGFDEACIIGTGNNIILLYGPAADTPPDEAYGIRCYVDFHSENFTEPFAIGQVVECTSETGTVDVTDLDKVFTYVPKFVDLGLPSGTKWAQCNLGAGSDYCYGKYFSWGNIDGVTSVDTEGIAAMTEAAYAQTKGASLTGDIPATAEYDAAVARFQGIVNCQIPTHAQFQELYDNCNWVWQESYQGSGIKGYLVTSKINGKSIFLPAAGYNDDGGLDGLGTYGFYWSSSIYRNDEGVAFGLYLNSENVNTDSNIHYRYYGYSVRPVQNATDA